MERSDYQFFLFFFFLKFEGDYKEGYYIGVEVAQDDPKAQKPFSGPNVWPGTGNVRNHSGHKKKTLC